MKQTRFRSVTTAEFRSYSTFVYVYMYFDATFYELNIKKEIDAIIMHNTRKHIHCCKPFVIYWFIPENIFLVHFFFIPLQIPKVNNFLWTKGTMKCRLQYWYITIIIYDQQRATRCQIPFSLVFKLQAWCLRKIPLVTTAGVFVFMRCGWSRK